MFVTLWALKKSFNIFFPFEINFYWVLKDLQPLILINHLPRAIFYYRWNNLRIFLVKLGGAEEVWNYSLTRSKWGQWCVHILDKCRGRWMFSKTVFFPLTFWLVFPWFSKVERDDQKRFSKFGPKGLKTLRATYCCLVFIYIACHAAKNDQNQNTRNSSITVKKIPSVYFRKTRTLENSLNFNWNFFSSGA